MKNRTSEEKSKLKEYLKEKGISPSYQRLKILDYLLRNKIHPSAETIYKELSEEVPVLSKTTIYNTINTFVKKGIISVLTIDGNELRYDCNTGRHTHFKCVRCGRVFDFSIDCPMFEKRLVKGNKILDCSIYVRGVCRDCLEGGKV